MLMICTILQAMKLASTAKWGSYQKEGLLLHHWWQRVICSTFPHSPMASRRSCNQMCRSGLPFVNKLTAPRQNRSAASGKEAGWQGTVGDSEEAGCSGGQVCLHCDEWTNDSHYQVGVKWGNAADGEVSDCVVLMTWSSVLLSHSKCVYTCHQ